MASLRSQHTLKRYLQIVIVLLIIPKIQAIINMLSSPNLTFVALEDIGLGLSQSIAKQAGLDSDCFTDTLEFSADKANFWTASLLSNEIILILNLQ